MKMDIYSKMKAVVFLGLWVLIAGVGCSKKSDTVLAVLDGEPVYEGEFLRFCERVSPATDGIETRKALLDQFLERKYLLQRAEAMDLANDPEFKDAYESLLIARLKEVALQPEIQAAVTLSDEELRSHYEARKSELAEPSKYQVAVLWLNPRGSAELNETYSTRLSEVRETFEASEISVEAGFGNLAITNSEHRSTRFKGGALGWLKDVDGYDAWRASVLEIAREMRPGETSEVVVDDQGVFLVRLMQFEEGGVRPYESVAAQLEAELKAARRSQAIAAFSEIPSSTNIEIHSERLEQLPSIPTQAAVIAGKINR